MERNVLRDDTGIPGSSTRRQQAGDQVGEDAGQDERAPAPQASGVVDGRGLAQVMGIAIAPAITLKSIYHWVPNNMSRVAAPESPPLQPTSASRRTGQTGVPRV